MFYSYNGCNCCCDFLQNFQCTDAPAGLQMSFVQNDTYNCAVGWNICIRVFFYYNNDCCYYMLGVLFHVELDCICRM